MSVHRTPRLIHPVNVTIERLERDVMIMDDDAREPIHGARTTVQATVTLPAQVKWTRAHATDVEVGGVHEEFVGYILCRIVDMDKKLGKGVRLKRGDRITKMGPITGFDLYIISDEYMAHLPLFNSTGDGGATLVKYHFQDRKPNKQSGDL